MKVRFTRSKSLFGPRSLLAVLRLEATHDSLARARHCKTPMKVADFHNIRFNCLLLKVLTNLQLVAEI